MVRAAVISLALAAPASAGGFVAVAYDRGAAVHGFGVADTAGAARKAALDICGATAANCKIGYTRANTCVSVATDFTSGGYGIHGGETAEAAERNVLEHCASFGNQNCTVVDTTCAQISLETN